MKLTDSEVKSHDFEIVEKVPNASFWDIFVTPF